MKLVIKSVLLIVLLTGGLLIHEDLSKLSLLIYIHEIVGFIALVIFIIFLIEHLQENQSFLFLLHRKTITGYIQILLGGLLFFSGFVLYLYSAGEVFPWYELHLYSTFIFFLSFVFHLKKLRFK